MRITATQPRPAAATASAFVVGEKVSIVGALRFDGPVQLEGHISGEIRCAALVIEESGAADGLIVADHVTVAGSFSGSIYANRLVLASTADVEGDIYHAHLVLEDGCNFEGKSRRHDRPLRLAPPDEEELGHVQAGGR